MTEDLQRLTKMLEESSRREAELKQSRQREEEQDERLRRRIDHHGEDRRAVGLLEDVRARLGGAAGHVGQLERYAQRQQEHGLAHTAELAPCSRLVSWSLRPCRAWANRQPARSWE